ncbi:MAG TPA: hypothetical protein DIW81_05500 [Planctomycetaceae bacterium]|nr:hypothetical protein [Planctomycetaceae bacterium]
MTTKNLPINDIAITPRSLETSVKLDDLLNRDQLVLNRFLQILLVWKSDWKIDFDSNDDFYCFVVSNRNKLSRNSSLLHR